MSTAAVRHSGLHHSLPSARPPRLTLREEHHPHLLQRRLRALQHRQRHLGGVREGVREHAGGDGGKRNAADTQRLEKENVRAWEREWEWEQE